MEGKILHKELSYKLVGLLFKAHKDLGRYKNEKQYGDYLEELFKKEGLVYEREYRFKDGVLGDDNMRCVCDFVIENRLVLELKAKDHISKEDYYQVKRYLSTLVLELGIIVNFRQPRIVPKRILNKYE